MDSFDGGHARDRPRDLERAKLIQATLSAEPVEASAPDEKAALERASRDSKRRSE